MRKCSKFGKMVLVVLVVGLVGCGQKATVTVGVPVANLIETRVPDIEKVGATAIYRYTDFPFSLRCEDIELDVVRPGSIWRNIQIGVTTYDEVISELEANGGEISMSWHEDSGDIRIFNNSKDEGLYWSILDVCFIGNVIASANFSYTIEKEYPRKLKNIVDKYGKPDVVTWGYNYWHRSLIWLDLGMLISIELEYDELDRIILFPPIYEAEFEDSWLYKILPKSIEGWGDPNLIDDLGRLPPDKEREDPWGFTDWWRIFD